MISDLLIVARIWHYAGSISLAGGLGFLVLVAEPAFRAAATEPTAMRRAVLRIAWTSLASVLLSGALWLLCEGVEMSGRPLAAVLGQGVLGTVLTRTQFGAVWTARFALAIATALALPWTMRRDRLGHEVTVAAAFTATAMLALLAGAGHAGSTPGSAGDWHLAADVLHLLAAGAWLGGLLPLVLLFAWSLRDPALIDAARRATRRFSTLGLVAVAVLLASGIVNTMVLVGTVPGLLGTPYGRLLLLKIVFFLGLVAIAAVNRERLTPRLCTEAPTLPTLRRLRRNALSEIALGMAVLCIVGILGILPPAEHTEPVWPLPFRFVPAALQADADTLLSFGMVALGVLALIYAALGRRGRWLSAAFGLGLVIGFAWQPIAEITEPAYPTSYFNSPVPDSATSVSTGARLFAAHCALCHGADGRGDGPAAANLPIKPANLTEAHLLAHNPGDLFWWISHGRGGAMPGFAGVLSQTQRWDVINFIRTRAGAAQPAALLPEVMSGPVPTAPDFTFEQQGRQDTLREALKRSAMLLVLYRLPGAEPRLRQLAAAEARLKTAGLRLVALPSDGTPPGAEPDTAPPDFAATGDAAMAAAYALFCGAGMRDDCELLIDRDGYLRARFRAGAGLPDAARLAADVRRMAELPLAAPPPHVHVH